MTPAHQPAPPLATIRFDVGTQANAQAAVLAGGTYREADMTIRTIRRDAANDAAAPNILPRRWPRCHTSLT
jgi:hypothetical protein